MFEAVKNWGRWGRDDERGALHFITPDIIKNAGRRVQTGEAVSCSLAFSSRPAPDNPRPGQHMMVVAGDACTHGEGMAGLDATCIPWLYHTKVALLGSDGVSDAIPRGRDRRLANAHSSMWYCCDGAAIAR